MSAVNPSELSRIALFAGLDDSDQRVVATWLDVGEFDPGYKLTHEGASGYAFFVLHDGTADVIVGGKVVRTLGAGDFFGELSMLGDGRQTATVTITAPSTGASGTVGFGVTDAEGSDAAPVPTLFVAVTVNV
ncbi:MAG TPA: cyclic nucleotide-binding domain-containing protein [Acidothermaceae bacterium]|nr:cyclic nucleotide-binding domain-containing protein [Acidothermaceae bacterium]